MLPALSLSPLASPIFLVVVSLCKVDVGLRGNTEREFCISVGVCNRKVAQTDNVHPNQDIVAVQIAKNYAKVLKFDIARQLDVDGIRRNILCRPLNVVYFTSAYAS